MSLNHNILSFIVPLVIFKPCNFALANEEEHRVSSSKQEVEHPGCLYTATKIQNNHFIAIIATHKITDQ